MLFAHHRSFPWIRQTCLLIHSCWVGMLHKEGNPPNHPENPRFNSFNTGIFEPIRIFVHQFHSFDPFFYYRVSSLPGGCHPEMWRDWDDPSNPNWGSEQPQLAQGDWRNRTPKRQSPWTAEVTKGEKMLCVGRKQRKLEWQDFPWPTLEVLAFWCVPYYICIHSIYIIWTYFNLVWHWLCPFWQQNAGNLTQPAGTCELGDRINRNQPYPQMNASLETPLRSAGSKNFLAYVGHISIQWSTSVCNSFPWWLKLFQMQILQAKQCPPGAQ